MHAVIIAYACASAITLQSHFDAKQTLCGYGGRSSCHGSHEHIAQDWIVSGTVVKQSWHDSPKKIIIIWVISWIRIMMIYMTQHAHDIHDEQLTGFLFGCYGWSCYNHDSRYKCYEGIKNIWTV